MVAQNLVITNDLGIEGDCCMSRFFLFERGTRQNHNDGNRNDVLSQVSARPFSAMRSATTRELVRG